MTTNSRSRVYLIENTGHRFPDPWGGVEGRHGDGELGHPESYPD